MKSVIFYARIGNPTPGHHLVRNIGTSDGVAAVYVRIEVVKTDAEKALSMAKPFDGETVLNTMDLPA